MKCIIADLDGTLIHKQRMSDRTKQTILKLQSTGYVFTLATGRHKDAVRRVVKELNIQYPVICTNGALIYDFINERIIHQDVIDESTVIQLMRILDEQKTDYLLYTTKHIVSNEKAKQRLFDRIGSFESLVVSKEALLEHVQLGILKILIIEPDQNKFDALRIKLSSVEHVYVLSSQSSFIDVGNVLSSKGRALEILANYLQIPLNDILSIGDQENDLSMIKTAGMGVAMGDGEDHLKQQADFITKSFYEEGFSHAIDTLIFKE